MPTERQEEEKRPSAIELWRDRVLVGVFVVGLAFPLVAEVLGRGRADAGTEKRRLAEFPSLAPDEGLRQETLAAGGDEWDAWVASIRRWPRAYEDWYDDHFAYRAQMIHAHHRLYVQGIGVSPRDDVAIGKDGWLFTNGSDQEQAALDQVRGLFPFSEQQLREWQRFYEECRDWFEDRGIPFVLTIAPSKPTIHPEQLPRWVRVRNPVTRMDQLVEWLAAMPERDGRPPIPLVDVRPALLEAKARYGSLYQRTDTHWNSLGAMIASSVVLDALRERIPEIPRIAIEDYEVLRAPVSGGDLAALLGLTDVLDDEWVRMPAREPEEFVREEEGMAPALIPVIQEDNVEFLAEERTTPFRLVCPGSRLPRLLMFRDSYATNMVVFLARGFSQSAFYWQYRVKPDIVPIERPDIVLQEIGERVLTRNVSLPKNDPRIQQDFRHLRAFRSSERVVAARALEPDERTLVLSLADVPAGEAAVLRLAGTFESGGTVRVRTAAVNGSGVEVVLVERSLAAWRDVVYARVERPSADRALFVEVDAPQAEGVVLELRAVPRHEASVPSRDGRAGD